MATSPVVGYGPFRFESGCHFMPLHLEDNTRLLDLLQQADMDQRPHTEQEVTHHLAQLCQVQGLTHQPPQIQKAAVLFLKQRETDQALVRLIQQLPEADQTQMDADRLRRRLQMACADQKIAVSPVQMDHALALSKSLKEPFRLWGRPATEEARTKALAYWKVRKSRAGVSACAVMFAGLGLSLLGLIGLAMPLGFFPNQRNWLLGLTVVSFLGGLLISGMLSEIMQPFEKPLPSKYKPWFRGRTMKEFDKLVPVKPNMDRLRRWQDHPQAASALKQLTATPVPLLETDADRLDALMASSEHDQAQQHAKKETAAWNKSLQDLSFGS